MDPNLLAICLVAALISTLGSLGIAARPAAARTSRVMLAFTVASLCFMLTRFANLLYGPLMAKFVDAAERTGHTGLLLGQIRYVMVASALGSVAAWVLLPTFIEIYQRAILSLERRRDLWRVALRLSDLEVWKEIWRCARPPGNFGVNLFRLEGVPPGFLLINVVATAIWSVGLLAALLVSAQMPQISQTAVLLSGMVNALAAIAFSVWVDPQAAIITDQAIADERPRKHIDIIAVHLALGNILGGLLGFFLLHPAALLIRQAAKVIGSHGQAMTDQVWLVLLINLFFALLASTTYVSRISAVRTGRAATAVAVYNIFFLVARLGQQVLSPFLGSLSDFFTANHLPLSQLADLFRKVLLGATLGTGLAILLMPSLIAIFDSLIKNADRRGSIHAILWAACHPKRWPRIAKCFKRPSVFGLKRKDFKRIPRSLVWANLLVISIHTVGVVASVYAGATLPELKRTACLLSSVVNGVATIMLSLMVDPAISVMTEEALQEKRPSKDIYALGVLMLASMLLGTVLSQCLLEPAKDIIVEGATILDRML